VPQIVFRSIGFIFDFRNKQYCGPKVVQSALPDHMLPRPKSSQRKGSDMQKTEMRFSDLLLILFEHFFAVDFL
jgi:hypothetical protein